MGSELLALGVSHKTAPVALRERLALMDRQADALVRELVGEESIDEAVVISTCNRTEAYLVVGDGVRAETALLGGLADRAAMRPTELASVAYTPRNCDAARQLFRVTGGLESMIVGEAEVQGQVRRAYELAVRAGTTGPLTNRLFTAALAAGKRVRSETALGTGGASVSSVAVDLARGVMGDLDERGVVVIGAGETAELTARALGRQGVRTIFVANRHAARARALAERFGGRVLSLDDLPLQLETTDIVVASTSSPHPIVGREELELVMQARDGRPLVLIDIAVPRDIDPECGDLDGVTLYDMDDLQATVARTLEARTGERVKAEMLIEEEIQRFARWMGQLDVTPTVSALRRQGEEVVAQVLAENAGRFEGATERDLERVTAIARAVMRRLLHEPTLRLKASGGEHARLQLVRELFALDAEVAPAAAEETAEVRTLRRAQ
ncbi:MAG TPA: glutamyl-tRNA reductase [Solirubrobacteraceae bacterium]|nr:glutamyl-tRNA reductase [Solirubrobacteraceae bacterium]